jgi:hypothetical protein
VKSKFLLFLVCLLSVLAGSTFADTNSGTGVPPGAFASPALKNAVILIIRHAEKPDSGYGLSPAGEARAQNYADYFQHLTLAGHPVKLSYIFAAADSKGSHRPRLTVEPASKALGLAIDSRIKARNFQELANEIESRPHGTGILIAWHHEEIPALLQALGADPSQVIPDSKWPGDVFGWLIELRYDANGQLVEIKRINEKLMPDDSR